MDNIDMQADQNFSWDDLTGEIPEIRENIKKPSIATSLEIRLDRNIIDRNCQLCANCGNNLIMKEHQAICINCGMKNDNNLYTEDNLSSSANTNCNVNDSGFIPIVITGNKNKKEAYNLQKNVLRVLANYESYRQMSDYKQIKNLNNKSEIHIPVNIIKQANDMFTEIKKKGYVFRKFHKKGVISACLYYKCYENGISKTPAEIAKFVNIEERFHSFGDRVLHSLADKGVIEIPIKISPLNHYVGAYLEALNIDMKYKYFILDLIDRAEKKKIHLLHDSKNNTKCVGAIYMLVERLPQLRIKISKDKIEAECKISKTTFIRYYKNLCQYYKLIKPVFIKHRIPLPVEWKN